MPGQVTDQMDKTEPLEEGVVRNDSIRYPNDSIRYSIRYPPHRFAWVHEDICRYLPGFKRFPLLILFSSGGWPKLKNRVF